MGHLDLAKRVAELSGDYFFVGFARGTLAQMCVRGGFAFGVRGLCGFVAAAASLSGCVFF